jgi:iron-sulfur cluster repair protein YtfE (RIC family)
MKRHPTLQQLSRDHQLALAVALELTRAVEATAPAARGRFLNFWRAEGRQHFRQEEEILLPAFARRGDPRHPIVARVLTDHVELRGDAAELAEDANPSPALLRRVGARLQAHVRREERQLFPLIESTLDDRALRALAARLAG